MKGPKRFLGSGFGSTLAVSEFVSVRLADRREFYGLAVHEKDILKIDRHTAPFLFQQATIDPPCGDPSSVRVTTAPTLKPAFSRPLLRLAIVSIQASAYRR
jgi:hypothetical protein